MGKIIVIIGAALAAVGCTAMRGGKVDRDFPATDMAGSVEMSFSFMKDTTMYGDMLGVGIEWRNVSEERVVIPPRARIMLTADGDAGDGTLTADVAFIYADNVKLGSSVIVLDPGGVHRCTVRVPATPDAFAEKPVDYRMLLRTGTGEGEPKQVFRSVNTARLTVTRPVRG